MTCKMAGLMLVLMGCCFACQTTPLPGASLEAQTTPSPSPSTAASDAQVAQVETFSLNQEVFCVGEELTLSLTDSNLGRGSIPIILTPAPEAGDSEGSPVLDPLVPGGNKRPLPLIENMVRLGEMPVSPIGTGSLVFTLAPEYTTPSGERIVLDPDTRYLLYWEPRPGALSFAVSFHTCP